MRIRMTMPKPQRRTAPVSTRPDRWTEGKMTMFLRELGATQSVSAAAKAVGMSRNSAYRLRARLKGEAFDIAWEAAFQHGYDALAQAALERALYGVEVPVWYKGEQVGTTRRYDEGLTRFLLSSRNLYGVQGFGTPAMPGDNWPATWSEPSE